MGLDDIFRPVNPIEAFDRYWNEIRGGKRWPSRADLDPVDIPRLLPYIYLIDVLGPKRFRFRLVGTSVVDHEGLDVTGLYVDELVYGGWNKLLIDHYSQVVETGSASDYEGSVVVPHREFKRYRRRLFPLSADGETVNMIVGVMHFYN